MPYISKTDVSNHLNITALSSAAEATLDVIIAGVEAAADTFCNRTFGATALQTELFDGNSDIFFPRKMPVSSITSVKIDGDLVAADDIYNYGHYIRLGYRAAPGNRIVEITYTPTETLPNDVKLALIQWAGQLFKAAEDGGKVTERVRVGEVELWFKTQDGMPKFVEQVLARYRVYPL
jgi:hypothetical protein